MAALVAQVPCQVLIRYTKKVLVNGVQALSIVQEPLLLTKITVILSADGPLS